MSNLPSKQIFSGVKQFLRDFVKDFISIVWKLTSSSFISYHRWITNVVFKLHMVTGSLVFLLSCFIFARELFGDHIHCIADGVDINGGKVIHKLIGITDRFFTLLFNLDLSESFRQFLLHFRHFFSSNQENVLLQR